MPSTLHRGGQRVRLALRAVIERDGPTCWRCGGPIDTSLSGLNPDGLTLGHRIPVAAGGSDALPNLGPEHRRCNLASYPIDERTRPAVALPRARIVRPRR
jgi:5-methylcytosine-specific restriction endonuclease McrA